MKAVVEVTDEVRVGDGRLLATTYPLNYTKLHCIAIHYTILQYTTLHYTALQYTTIHCTVLHCTEVQFSAKLRETTIFSGV